jgi:CBS domain-containing protein
MTVPATQAIPTSLDAVRVEDAMHRGVLSCPFETPLRAVARLMAENGVHCVVGVGDVTEGDTTLWGVVSDRDLLAVAAAGEEDEHDAGSRAVSSSPTVAPGDSLRHAAQLMLEHGVSHLVVAEPGHDRPLGVLSTLDLARVLGGVVRRTEAAAATRVDELMTTPVVTAAPETPLKEVAGLLVRHGISGLPIVSEGELVGIVSEADIVSLELAEGRDRSRSLTWLLREKVDHSLVAAKTAADVMSSPPITIAQHRSPATAAALMTMYGIKRLPVLHGDHLVGIVSRSDLVRAFARPDDALAREICVEVIGRDFWIAPGAVQVEVHDGEVTLSGSVESPATAEALPEAVRKVPGVVSVTSELAARR